MYPLLCKAGYAVPLKAGHFDIMYILAPGSDTNSTSRLTLLDDPSVKPLDKFGNFLDDKLLAHDIIFDEKRVAACNANIRSEPKEPIRVRNGISVLNATNLVAGSIFVYVR